MDAARAWFDVGFDELILEPLAVRGESLILSRGGYRAADGREVMFLAVYELDRDGLIARGTHFDEDEIGAALASSTSDTSPGRSALRLDGERSPRVGPSLAQDNEGAKKYFAPGFEFVDHRALSWPLTMPTVG